MTLEQMNDMDSALRLHQSTKHGTPPARPEKLVQYRRLDPLNAPTPFKEYRDREVVALPRELVPSTVPATAVLSGGKGEKTPLDAPILATLLFLSAGVTRMMGSSGRRLYFRAAMSAGNLHPIEVYVVAGVGMAGIAAGVHHFSPFQFGLTSLRDGDYRDRLGVDASLAIVLTGIPWRTAWKYGERGWRHLYWDAGTMLANLLAVADAHGLAPRIRIGFDDAAVSDLLGIDGGKEMPLAIVEIGQGHPVATSSSSSSEPLVVDVAPLAPQPIHLPLLEEAQAGSSLHAEEIADWLRAGDRIAGKTRTEVPKPADTGDTIGEVIRRRGSTRSMVRQAVAHDHIRWPLASATRAVGLDVAPTGTLLNHFVNVHAVEGIDPGAYRYADGDLELIRASGRERSESAGLCLGQPLGGDSSYTVFHCSDLESVVGSLGSRGYRAAQLESGVVSGRLALCAFALGLGATGLTFFDDEVSRFFETAAQPMLVTSVGVPASRPAPAGEPGNPAVLRQ